ncbi:MAG: glycine-rich domain-containing protein [Candidatus Gracilibacteria bacterium]
MSLKNNKKQEINCIKNNKKGFTLVELIVVITILAILGTIAFISFQNYTKNSRDGVRIADINTVKKTLELFITDKGFYPLPDNGSQITYSGATAWVQGTLGDNVIINLGRINKKPVDPLTNNEYTYSVTNAKTEYQLSSISEGGLSYDIPLINQANATTTKTAIAMVTGSYNEKMLKVSTGGIDYVIAVPSIINANLDVKDIPSIIANKQLVYNRYSNIPDSYKNSGYTMTGGFEFIPTSGNIVVYSGSTDTLTLDANKIIFLNNLKSVYNGSILQTEPIYNDVITVDTTNNQTGAISLVKSYVDNNVGGITGNATAITYGCAVQPSYTHADFIIGNPTQINQSRQNSISGSPCYYSCIDGYTGSDCNTAPFTATGGIVTYTDSNGLNPRSYPKYPGGYTVHTFLTSGNFTVTGSGNVEYLVVAGGGGATANANGGGGGGAGGLLQGSLTLNSQSYGIIIGNGGSGSNIWNGGTNGENSSFAGLIAIGGGRGGASGVAGGSGGGGGGNGNAYQYGGSGVTGQGNAGGTNNKTSPYPGGGGGGAGGVGINGIGNQAGSGGPGIYSNISGISVAYAGGGGCGGTSQGSKVGSGGIGGGGAGGLSANGTNGTPNTGGGGGGGSNSSPYYGGNGGSGIVIIRYLIN